MATIRINPNALDDEGYPHDLGPALRLEHVVADRYIADGIAKLKEAKELFEKAQEHLTYGECDFREAYNLIDDAISAMSPVADEVSLKMERGQ